MTAPLRAFRDHYVAPYGGVSYDLEPRAVGVHPEDLAGAPELAGRTVLVSREGERARPLHLRPTFTIVALTRLMEDAVRRVASGSLVFSSFDLDDPTAGDMLAGMHEGDPVFLNASVDRLPAAALRRPDFAA
jgi:hypothetical protein